MTKHSKALGKKMLATGKIERQGDEYVSTVRNKRGSFQGKSKHPSLALTQALYESKKTKKRPWPGRDTNLLKD